MAPAPDASLSDKIGFYAVQAKTILLALTHFLSTPIRSEPRLKPLYKDCMFRALRYHLSSLNLSQQKWGSSSTEANYLELAKKRGFQPEALVLPSGCKAHWFGERDAEKTIVYLHGGGYVLSASQGHLKWLYDMTQDLSKHFSVNVLLLGYTCAPEAQYPAQLCEAVELLDNLINAQRRRPQDIILAGDSAGGNLALALISHILHPHPDVPTKIHLDEPLRAAVLVSPWVDFDVNQTSFDRNVNTDYLTKVVGACWSGAFMGSAKPDKYNQPKLADAAWFKNVDSVVGDVLIWGGGGEVLIDSIEKFAEGFKAIHPNTDYIVEPGASHEDFIIERLIGYNSKSQGAELIEKWISSRL